jgi:predicted acylesterase/phospholipase RssA
MRADEVARFALERENLLKADLIVTPKVSALDWADFSHPAERIALGEQAARQRLDAIRELVERFESMFIQAPAARASVAGAPRSPRSVP